MGSDGADFTVDNALSEHLQFGLKQQEAEKKARRVAAVVGGRKDHFAAAGVRMINIEAQAQQIDRPFSGGAARRADAQVRRVDAPCL